MDTNTSHNALVDSNKAHFDVRTANNYDEHPLHVEMAKRIGKSLIQAYTWDEERTEVLDCACGTADLVVVAGLISRQILPYVKSVLGADISQAMVDKYNERADNQGITSDEMKAICANIEEPSQLGDLKFDVVLCSMSYHHFTNPMRMTGILANLLKPGGCLFVADIESTKDREEIIPETANHVVAHKYGFSEAEVKSYIESAGLSFSRFTSVTKARKNGKEVNVFLAQGINHGT
ncbi:hypothetical protein PQX77_001422 [Marasmius sp. AFHP31]|nr:hypothetical protein PQX77_001422 [Marasmius sp. AFHP31]